MSGETVRLGLIGAGRWGRNYIKTLNALPGVDLAYLASSNPENASLAGRDCKVMTDWRTLVLADAIDGVIIATPPPLHADMMKMALAANKAVLVEKPVTQNMAEASHLLEIARAERAIVHVDHIHLYSPGYRALKRLSGDMGAIQGIRSAAGAWGPFRKETSVLWDWGAHDVSMALDLLGSFPEDIQAQRRERRETAEGFGEALTLHLTFPDGVKTAIDISNLREQKQRFLAVDFKRETLIYDDVGESALLRRPRAEDAQNEAEKAQVLETADIPPLNQVVLDFVDAVKRKEPDIAGLELGVQVVRVLSACEQALGEA